MTADANSERIRAKIEESLAKMAHASRAFADRVRSHTGIDVRDLIDPEGEAVASLVDVEGSTGAASLAQPIDLIVFETWLLGQIGDQEELDLDINTHRELWNGLGAWVADVLKDRHGGFWLIGGEDPRVWRMGFSKILLEVTPHVFAERLLRSGQGLARRLIGEIERIRGLHDEADQAEGGSAKDKFGPNHYARIHSVPLAQWMVFDMPRLQELWGTKSIGELTAALKEAATKLPPQSAPFVERLLEALGKGDAQKPAKDQSQDRHLYEAVAQILAMRRTSNPLAIDMVEKLVMPAMHMGVPNKFPPLGDDDVDNLKKGADLFALMVDVVPFAHAVEEGGFLGTFAPTELGTPYPDRSNLEIGKGDWVAINPSRLVPMLRDFDPQKLVAAFDRFAAYVQDQPGVPRLKDVNRGLVETAARAIAELRACVGAATQPGHALVFRLLPPPQ
jgi:hypothetical protein